MSILGSLLGGGSNRPEPSETMQSNAGGLMSKFNPFNLVSGMFGRKKSAADNYAGTKGGMRKGLKDSKKKDPKFVSKVARADVPPQKGESVTNIASKIYSLLKKNQEKKTKELEIEQNFSKSLSNIKEKRNQQLIEALTKQPKGLKKETKNIKKESDKVKKETQDAKKEASKEKGASKGPAPSTQPPTAVPKGPAPSAQPSAAAPKPSATPAPKPTPSATRAPSGVASAGGGGGLVAVAAGVVAGGTLAMASAVIAKEEGLPKGGKAYWDPPNQKNLVSIGYGHQIKDYEYKQGFIQAGSEQIPIRGNRGIDTVLTKEQAQLLLQQDLPKYAEAAKKPLGDSWEKLNDQQKSALISYAYNTGSTASLVKQGIKGAIDSGDTKGAAAIIRDKGIRTAGGQVNSVLVERRAKEAELFEAKDLKSESKATPASTPAKTGEKVSATSTENKDLKKQAASAAGGPIVVNQTNNIVASADNSKTMTVPRSDASTFARGAAT
jgi:GH24 family phage-related lysozyme (muramidase)